VGSLLLARRVKRQTLGLEPREIAGLVEQREALLHGIKEGVLAVDLDHRITMVNDEAAHLLGIPLTSGGHTLQEVDATGRAALIFTEAVELTDHVMPVRGRVLTVNRMPVRSRGRHIGWVATMRDRTEMLELQRELDLTKSTTDTLRAQAHEFSNRMHVVSGLIALEEYDGVRNYVRQITDDSTTLTTNVVTRVQDPAVAALLIAKASQATERGVDLVVDPSSDVPQLDDALAADVNTVMGNLIDNAFDAAAGGAAPTVRVALAHTGEAVTVTVRDSGPGVDSTIGEMVFDRGFTTKSTASAQERGIGLAIVRVICRNRGGDIVVGNDEGAVFVATLPVLVGQGVS
jgi:sensor histidine kinase regulating citrate/malate metabolism